MTSLHAKAGDSRLQRYEMKYCIPPDLIGPIARFIGPYCRLDEHSARSPDFFYTVKSLYLDTPALLFLRQKLARCDNRFTLRVRCYGEGGQSPIFFEVKHKKANIVKKYRSAADAGLPISGGDEVLAREMSDYALSNADVNRRLFDELRLSYHAVAHTLIVYRRMAFISECEEYARVTFDTALRCMPQDRWSFAEDGLMDYFDYSNDPHCDRTVVLELKCYTTHVPAWMMDLVQRFDLRRQRFSKYVNAQRRIGVYDGFGNDDCFDSLSAMSAHFG